MAARRHQVENLVLRGTVFYWRPRIPVGFAVVRNSARLSFSLRLSDRKKASLMARRLNALLHEIEVRPAARMSTKEQLTKIFALEIEAMHDEIEGLDRAAKHVGTLRDAVHREADRQVGWAYRLLEARGIGEKLSFEPGGEGRKALLEVGVDPDDIPFIAATYVAEREGARRGPFLADVLRRMAQVGLDDTTLNRDAATEQIHKARAEALLGSAARSRAIRLGERQEEPVRPPRVEAAEMPVAKPALLWEADPVPLENTDVSSDSEPETAQTTSDHALDTQRNEPRLVVTAYAQDLANPRTVHTLPNGDVLVVQSKAPPEKPLNRPKDVIRDWIMAMAAGDGGGEQETNLITLLRDTDRDGEVDERVDLLTGLTSPFGVAWHAGTLYVAAADAILSYPYELGSTEITAEPTILAPLPGGPINHHWTKDLALSPDGRFLYASVGSNSNAGERGLEAEKGRAAIWQVDRETGASRVFASGLRNPNGLNIHPETGELWTVVNERDELGPDLVPDYLTSVQENGFYGWPWSYFGQHVDQRVYPPRPDLVETAIVPDYALSSHVAALGLAFTNDSAMPEEYLNGAFVGNRGSWNRSAFNGYKVIFIPYENGRPSGMAQDIVTGFLEGDEARGRPVGLAIDGTGALLIADDAGNTVWRVAAADGTITPEPLPTDRVVQQQAVPDGDSEENAPAIAPDNGAQPAEPSQTEIAPAVSPEDGAGQPEEEAQ